MCFLDSTASSQAEDTVPHRGSSREQKQRKIWCKFFSLPSCSNFKFFL